MARYEFSRRFLTCQEFSLGPLRWRSTSMREVGESDGDSDNPVQTFAESLRALIHQALSEGCTSQELNTILGQHTLGDSHGDS